MGSLVVDTDHEDSGKILTFFSNFPEFEFLDDNQHYSHHEDQGFNAAYESKEVIKKNIS